MCFLSMEGKEVFAVNTKNFIRLVLILLMVFYAVMVKWRMLNGHSIFESGLFPNEA